MSHGGARKRDSSEAGQVKREKRSDYWARLQKKLDKHNRKWIQKRNREAEKFAKGVSCGGMGKS